MRLFETKQLCMHVNAISIKINVIENGGNNMANYACFCPGCLTENYTAWGSKKCPECGAKMIQSRVEQATFLRFTDEQKLNTFIPLANTEEEKEAINKCFLPRIEAKERTRKRVEEAKKKLEEKEEAERIEKDKILSSILISSGFNFEGYRIVKYSGYISGDDATTIPRVSGILTSHHGQNLTDALVKIRIQALKELKEAAHELGCNAVIGVDFDYLTLEPERASLLDSRTTVKEDYVICVTANGNAVVIEKI